MFDRTLLDGIFAPIVTPFDAEEAICYEAIRDNIQFYNNHRPPRLYALGLQWGVPRPGRRGSRPDLKGGVPL